MTLVIYYHANALRSINAVIDRHANDLQEMILVIDYHANALRSMNAVIYHPAIDLR